jgi:VRR-NUC domain-containing protein
VNATLLRTITEKQFQAQVLELAQRLGWKTHHTWTQIHSPAGFPDLVMARGSRIVFAELKSQKGRVTLEQRDWLARLRVAGAEAYLWRPEDWDTIITLLGSRRRPAGYHAYGIFGEGTATHLAGVDA